MKFEDVINNSFINPTSYSFAITLTLGFSLFVAVFLVFPFFERITNAKQVQLMTGVHPMIFWSSNLLWDIGMLLISVFSTIIVLVALDSDSYFRTNGGAGKLKYCHF